MEESFWHEKWANGDTGFHESEGNALLKQYFESLNLPKGGRVFLPLCGKTRDISWLLSNGYWVIGIELSELAVQQLFEDLEIKPEKFREGELDRYQANNIDIFVGDVFNLSADLLGSVDAVYDRAALVALPTETRILYADHLMKITHSSPQLLVCFEYDQNLMEGPPFSISHMDVKQYYGENYDIETLECKPLQHGLKGQQIVVNEIVWLLQTAG